MCGLTGFLDSAVGALGDAEGRIRAMTICLRHRGPDAQHIWIGEGIALGHRRLAVVELSDAGAQPMASVCGRYFIAFNGEIYNHADLRRDLEGIGAAPGWRGHSDTETLLAGIACWGLDETLRKAAGMFAIALWDAKERRLLLARDRMGEKPLYWGHAGRTLVFGSELKALRQHPDFPADICRQALLQYLRFGYVPAPRSIHPSIWKLEPGCILEVAGAPSAPLSQPLRPGEAFGPVSIRRYWSLDTIVEAGRREVLSDETQAVEVLETALSAAVRRQMMADVPLGAFLSGGIDSSLIVALMQSQTAYPVRTFTIGFEQAAFNEAPHAAAVAQHLGTNHSEIMVTEAETRQVIPLLPDLYDEPFADSSQIATYLVCRAARQQVTVALSGDGGDELFGGYNRYFWGPRIWRRLDRVPLSMRRAIGAGIAAVPIPAWDGLAGIAGRIGGPAVARAGDKAHKLASRIPRVRTLDDLYRSLVSEWDDPSTIVRGAGAEPASLLDDALPQGLDPASRMMTQDMRSYLPDDILCKVDRAAMGVSLETRVPFLDPAVIALSARFPLDMKIRDNCGKWALRQVLYRHVPAKLIKRPKAGFGIPVGEWIRGPLRDWAEDLLSEQRLSERGGGLDAARIRKIWAEHLSGRRDWTVRLWIVLMLQAWQQRWQ